MCHDVGDAEVLLGEEAIFEGVCDGVSGGDGEVSVYFDVDVDEVVGSAFAYVEGFESYEAGGFFCGLADAVGEDAADVAVEELVEGGLGESVGVEEDESADEEGGHVVGAGEAVSAEGGDDDSDEDSEGGKGVHTVVPGFDFEGGALGVFAFFEEPAEEDFLTDDDDDEGGDDEGGGGFVGVEEGFDGVDSDDDGGGDEGACGDEAGDGFGFSVAVGVFFVGLAVGDAESVPDDEGGEDVGDGFDAVGYEGVGVACEADEELADGEGQVGHGAEGSEFFA